MHGQVCHLGGIATMTPLQVVAACGIISSCLASAGGFTKTPFLLGLAGLTMLTGNLYALFFKESK